MYRTMYFIVGIACMLTLINCSKSKTEADPGPSPDSPQISIQPLQKTLPAEGETFPLTITTNRTWTITHLPAWITTDKQKGEGDSKINLSCAPRE